MLRWRTMSIESGSSSGSTVIEFGMLTICAHPGLSSASPPQFAQGQDRAGPACGAAPRAQQGPGRGTGAGGRRAFSYLMIFVIKLRGYVRSATMGIRTRSTSTLGYSFSRLSTMACGARQAQAGLGMPHASQQPLLVAERVLNCVRKAGPGSTTAQLC